MFAVGMDALTSILKTSFIITYILHMINLITSTTNPAPDGKSIRNDNGQDSLSSKYLSNSICNDNIKEIIFGSLLGDGFLELPPRGINARFIFSLAPYRRQVSGE